MKINLQKEYKQLNYQKHKITNTYKKVQQENYKKCDETIQEILQSTDKYKEIQKHIIRYRNI